MILPISKLPAKILRIPVESIIFPIKNYQIKLVRNMILTCKTAHGVGLAAPQIGKNLNLAVIFLAEAGLPPFPIVNPKIIKSSKQTTTLEEGCLSMPGVFGKVTRPKKITVEAFNLDGEKFEITDDTFLARVLQHEIDHLNQILIIDKFDEVTTGEDLLKRYQ